MMTTQEYNVKLDIFEGPLDLLLHLIKVNEMEISEISISAITQQYLDYLRLMEELDLQLAGDFLVMAATLINIKLRALLPDPEEEIEEEAEELDDFLSARQLMGRLIEYRRFKEAAHNLGSQAERQAQTFIRDVALPKLTETEQDELVRGDLDRLLKAFSRVLKFVDRRDFHRVAAEEFSIEEKIALVRQRLRGEERLAISEIFGLCRAKVEMIATLIALLELCRLKEIRVSQADSFGEVFIFHKAAQSEFFDKVDEAERLAEVEAEILANRTGVVDDGVLPEEDDEDRLIDRILAEDPQMAEAARELAQTGEQADEIQETEAPADRERAAPRIIEMEELNACGPGAPADPVDRIDQNVPSAPSDLSDGTLDSPDIPAPPSSFESGSSQEPPSPEEDR